MRLTWTVKWIKFRNSSDFSWILIACDLLDLYATKCEIKCSWFYRYNKYSAFINMIGQKVPPELVSFPKNLIEMNCMLYFVVFIRGQFHFAWFKIDLIFGSKWFKDLVFGICFDFKIELNWWPRAHTLWFISIQQLLIFVDTLDMCTHLLNKIDKSVAPTPKYTKLD